MSNGLEWVKLHTSILTDDDWLDLSASGKVLGLMALARSGADGSDGLLRDNPRHMARYTGLSPDECAAARDELLEMGFLVRVDDAKVAVRNWSRYQLTTAERDKRRSQKSAAGKAGAAARWGKKATVAEKAAAARADEAPTPTAAPEPTDGPLAGAGKVKASEIWSDLRAKTEAACGAAPDSVGEVLEAAAGLVPQYVERYADRSTSKDLARYLFGNLGAWVVDTFWGDAAQGAHNRGRQVAQSDGARGLRLLYDARALDPSARAGWLTNQMRGRAA